MGPDPGHVTAEADWEAAGRKCERIGRNRIGALDFLPWVRSAIDLLIHQLLL